MYKLITTEKRGVFMGKLISAGEDVTGRYVEIESAQMCVYWDKAIRGVLGLASEGPGDRCRITAPVPGITRIGFVTSESDVTNEAVKRWQSCPWG